MAYRLPTFGGPPVENNVTPPTFGSTGNDMATPPASQNPTQAAGDSVIEQLLAAIKGRENPVSQGSANVGQVLGSFANDERANRLSKGALSQNYDKIMLDAQAARDASENDALRKIAITNYLKSGGYTSGPVQVQLEGTRTLPSFGSGPRPASAAQMSSAGTLEDMLKQRLASGGSYLPTDLSTYATPGLAENIGRYGGTAASGLGAINEMMGGKGNVLSSIGGGLKKVGGGIIKGLGKLF